MAYGSEELVAFVVANAASLLVAALLALCVVLVLLVRALLVVQQPEVTRPIVPGSVVQRLQAGDEIPCWAPGQCRQCICPRAQRKVESARAGSDIHKTHPTHVPSFQAILYGSRDGENWEQNGSAFRVGSHIYVTKHQLEDYSEIMISKDVLAPGVDNNKAIVVPTGHFEDVFTDVCAVRLSEADFSLLGLSKPKVSAVPLSRVAASITANIGGDFLTSSGELASESMRCFGIVSYSGSTKAGFSGSPYYSGNTVYGIHQTGGLANIGVDAGFLQSMVVKPEGTEDFIFRMMSRKRTVFRRNIQNATVTIFDGERYHTVDEDAFEAWEEQQDEFDYEGRTYGQEDEERLERGAVERMRARANRATGAWKDKWARRADELEMLYRREPEGLKDKTVQKLSRPVRDRVTFGSTQYVDIPEEERQPADLARVPEEIAALRAAFEELAANVRDLKVSAEVLPETTPSAQLAGLQDQIEAELASMDDALAELNRYRTEFASQSQRMLKQAAELKREGRSDDAKVVDQHKRRADLVMAETVKPVLAAANATATPLRANSQKLTKAKKKVQRVGRLGEILDQSKLDLPELLRMLAAADAFSTEEAKRLLTSAGYATTPALEERQSGKPAGVIPSELKPKSQTQPGDMESKTTKSSSSSQKPTSAH